nr:hypothetical protein BaRGS_001303 [Batillaria attramentaria]
MMFGGTKQAPATGGFCFGGTVLPSAPVLFGGAASESDNCDVTQGAAAVESQEATPDEIAPFSVADELTDVVLEVEGKELHVNRAVLAHYSPVFSRMFFGDFKEKDQTKVTLPGKSYVHFTTFLQVMYPQTTETPELISDENLVQILELAEEYQVDNVKIRCQDYIGEQLADYFAMYYRATKPGKQPATGSFVFGTPCSGDD